MVIDKGERARQLLHSIDNRDIDAFMTFLADDVVFRFGNADPVNGKAAVCEVVDGFFGSINSLHHDLERVWNEDDAIICHGNVTYTRHDLSTLRVPFANVLLIRDDLIAEYLIFVDTSELYSEA